MIKIIAHRGFWLESSEQNTVAAFERALRNGFGIETDLRDHRGDVVISHDMPNDSALPFVSLLELCNQFNSDLPLALNVKADGLQSALMSYQINNPHFYFDMSVPDMLGYLQNDMLLYSRYSEIESSPSLYAECGGIWLDNFSDEALDLAMLGRFLGAGKAVSLVSPELHKRDEGIYWKDLKQFLNSNPKWSPYISLCTDFPSKAREYFYEK